jgi:hypothetical protein
MLEKKLSKNVVSLGNGEYKVPFWYYQPSLETLDLNGVSFTTDKIIGVTNDDLRGCTPAYHVIGEDKIPKKLIKTNHLFSYTEDNDGGWIYSLVTDLDIAKEYCDEFIRENGNVENWGKNSPKEMKDLNIIQQIDSEFD